MRRDDAHAGDDDNGAQKAGDPDQPGYRLRPPVISVDQRDNVTYGIKLIGVGVGVKRQLDAEFILEREHHFNHIERTDIQIRQFRAGRQLATVDQRFLRDDIENFINLGLGHTAKLCNQVMLKDVIHM